MPYRYRLYPDHPRLSFDTQPKKPLLKLKRTVVVPIGPSIAYVPLTRGQFALIDAADADVIGQFNWHAAWNRGTQSFYAVRDVTGGGKCFLHTVVLKPKAGLLTDHANGVTLDNRRTNLRPATVSQNAFNSRRRANATGLKGVHRNHNASKYASRIRKNGETFYLGSFPTAQAAYEAYCAAAANIHGEYRRLA